MLAIIADKSRKIFLSWHISTFSFFFLSQKRNFLGTNNKGQKKETITQNKEDDEV